MIKLQIEGSHKKVSQLLLELEQRSSIEVIDLQNREDVNEVTLQLIHSPDKRQKIVKLMTKDGQELHIPLLDTIQARFENIHFISGFSIDIFS
ncbi:hypothetical protein [Thermoactinomyces sp. CICC 10521]|uniref:hypothetical protein n=1 Tax=Thermoactinomyces sp. CICC 10521 TaxID=2767426 RepID=UPI0018DDF470|nr:hypothetical protein [Thermoactinomyces sp. CICC 10521]MBH8609083.1 hypothetical protein [Thermoactinomyces sp. CICC 10521]